MPNEVRTDYGGSGGIKEAQGRNWQRILLPIVGLILIVSSAVIAYILSDPVGIWVRENLVKTIPRDATKAFQGAVGFSIFLIIVLVFAAIYAAIAPKPIKGVSESELDKEKKEKLLEEERAKRRKREMKNKMRQQRK